MFGTRYLGSRAMGGTQICAQVASARGSTRHSCRYFSGACCFRLISIATVFRSSRPGSLPKNHLCSFSGSLLRAWLASIPDDLRFPALRFVRATGERLYAQDVLRLSRHLDGDWRIGHSYSSGEAGTIAVQVFTASRLPEPGIVAVGPPVDGVEVFIEDERGTLVPPGEIGEIVVRSRYLARGYWNNPDLTAKVFQTDPLDSAIRIYRTGDLGRWRNDGTLEHVGRKGRTIRLRGYNVEPFQVECELMRQPNVTDAVVLLYEGAAAKSHLWWATSLHLRMLRRPPCARR